MVSLQEGGGVEAPPNHLSAKGINNAGWSGITHSAWDECSWREERCLKAKFLLQITGNAVVLQTVSF